MWGWSKKASASREALDGERNKLSMSIELLETKRRDANTAYVRGIQSKLPRARLRALLEARNSLDRRIAVAGRLQNKVDLNIEALESSQLMTSVLGTLESGTKVLQSVPGRSGAAFDSIDDNAIALDEVNDVTGALSGVYDGEDPEVEAELDRDLGGASVVETPSLDLGLPAIPDEVPELVSRAELLKLSQREPLLEL